MRASVASSPFSISRVMRSLNFSVSIFSKDVAAGICPPIGPLLRSESSIETLKSSMAASMEHLRFPCRDSPSDTEKIMSSGSRVRLRCARDLPRLDRGTRFFFAIADPALLVRNASAGELLAAQPEGRLHYRRAAILASRHGAPCDFPPCIISREPATTVGNYCRIHAYYFRGVDLPASASRFGREAARGEKGTSRGGRNCCSGNLAAESPPALYGLLPCDPRSLLSRGDARDVGRCGDMAGAHAHCHRTRRARIARSIRHGIRGILPPCPPICSCFC